MPAVAYRKKEDAPMQVSKTSPFHERLAALTNHFGPARDLWAATSFTAIWCNRGILGLSKCRNFARYEWLAKN